MFMLWNLFVVFFVPLIPIINCNFSIAKPHREHKVHNIVLYPDKHSWCTTTAIVQVVSHPGCSSVKMNNNVCVGACFSYIVPRTIPDTPGDVLPYCDSCQPGHTTWKKVVLECNEQKYKTENLTKYVEMIHDCNCGTCKDQLAQRLPNEEDLNNDYNIGADLNEESLNSSSVLGLESDNSTSNSTSSVFKEMIADVLKKMTNEDERIMESPEVKGLHKNVWKSLLQKVESIDSSMDSAVFAQLVKKVEEESQIKFNYKRLKQALLKLKRHQEPPKEKNKSNEEIPGPHHSLVFAKDSVDIYASGLYSKMEKMPAEIAEESASPIVDIAPQYLKPATEGSEISYHDNLVAVTNKVDVNNTVQVNTTTIVVN